MIILHSDNDKIDDYKRRLMLIFPYPEMKEAQKVIVNTIGFSNKPMLFSTRTGVGKTAAILSSLLALKEKDEKIVIFVRTKAQIDVYIRELSNIYQKISKNWGEVKKIFGHFPFYVPLIGKKELCTKYRERFPPTLYLNICNMVKCPLKSITQSLDEKKLRELVKIFYNDLTFFQSYEELYSKIKNRGFCPYYFSYFLLQKADIILATYSFLQNDLLFNRLLSAIKTPLNKLLIAVDEAHNLYKLYSEEISYGIVVNAVKESNFKIFRDFLSKFDKEAVFELSINNDILETIGKELVVRVATSLRNDEKPPLSSFLLYQFLLAAKGKKLLSNKEAIKIMQIDPSVIIKKIKPSKRLILISGSFEPLTSFRKLFGLKKAQMMRIFPSGVNNAKYFIVTDKLLNGQYSSRNNAYFEHLAQTIEELVSVIPRHIIVFVPSYNYLSMLSRHLNKDEYLFEQKEQDVKLIEGILKNSEEKRVIFSIIGGKVSEGVEFTANGKSLIAGIIVTALPYPPPSFEKELYYNVLLTRYGKKLALEFTVTIPMLQKLQQSFGRAIRDPKVDKAVHILLDPRATKYTQIFQFERFSSLALLKRKISSFFNKT